MKQKILLCSFLVIIILGAVLISFMFKDTSQYNIALQEESIIVSINPKVLFNTNNKGYVKEVLHINEDAKIYKEEDFLGLEINKAIDKAIEVAKENGYVKSDTIVNVSSLSSDSVYLEDIVLNLKGNKINVKTEKLSKEAIETIMSNIDTTGNVETEFIVLDDDYVIIKKKSDIKGPGPSEEELNNQIENNNSNNNKQEEEQKKEENNQNTTTNNNNSNNSNNDSNDSNIGVNPDPNETTTHKLCSNELRSINYEWHDLNGDWNYGAGEYWEIIGFTEAHNKFNNKLLNPENYFKQLRTHRDINGEYKIYCKDYPDEFSIFRLFKEYEKPKNCYTGDICTPRYDIDGNVEGYDCVDGEWVECD